MGTRIILGALLTDVSILIAALLYLGARNPKNPKWAGEQVMTWILPLVTGGIVVGPFLLAEGFIFNFSALGSTEIVTTLVILGVGVGALLLMRIPKRVAAYEAGQVGQESHGQSPSRNLVDRGLQSRT